MKVTVPNPVALVHEVVATVERIVAPFEKVAAYFAMGGVGAADLGHLPIGVRAVLAGMGAAYVVLNPTAKSTPPTP